MGKEKAAILVTGGTGNIGAWVTRWLLDEGFLPVVYDLKPDLKYLKDISDKVNIVTGDITDFDKLDAAIKENKVKRVIHLAKYVGERCEEYPRTAVEVNVLGSANVIEAARINGIKRVVFSSSRAVYAPATGKHAYPDLVPITEDWPLFERRETGFVVTFYSTTNKMAEYFGIRMAIKYDMEFIILRFGQVWGPGKMGGQLKYQETARLTEAFVVSAMIDDTIKGKSTDIPIGGNPEDSDDYVYNKDVAQGVVKACLSDKVKFEGNHREYNIGSGKPHIIADFAAVLRARFPGVSIKVGDSLFQHHAHRAVHSMFDPSRARKELGYEPAYADLKKAVDDYIETEKAFGS